MTKSKRIDAPVKTPFNDDKNSTDIGDELKPENLKKPKILYQDQGGFERCISAYKNVVVPEINKFAEMYETTMGKPFDQGVFSEIIERSQRFIPDTDEYKDQLINLIEEKCKNQDKALHNLLAESYKSEYDSLIDAFDSLQQAFERHFCDGLYWQEIRIEKNRAVFTKSDENRIWERYFVMKDTDSPETKKLAELCDKYVSVHNDLNDHLKENANKFNMNFGGLWLFKVMGRYAGLLKYNDQGHLEIDYKIVYKPKTINDFENQKEDERELSEAGV